MSRVTFMDAMRRPELIGELTINEFLRAIETQGKDHIAISMRDGEGIPAKLVAVVAVGEAAKSVDAVVMDLAPQDTVVPVRFGIEGIDGVPDKEDQH